ncbi:MAG: CoA transferase [Chloroflexi bacterium]|nr:CoA transferase [Chloroflexota bacterium]
MPPPAGDHGTLDGPHDRSESGPLAGVRVCDLSTVLAGPYCTMLLADLGAEVIKIEPPGGDPTRHYGPPYAGAPDPHASYAEDDPRADPDYAGESGYYLSINRNKRGIRLDLRQADGREVLRRILERSDVLVENQRSGGLDGLGFPDEDLDRINPRLVRLSITGYGPTGPDAGKPGFDFIIQAAAGLMSITGQADEVGGEPTKVGVAVADLTTGMLGAVAVLAGLREAERTGRGQRIDLSILESSVAWLINQAANHLVGGAVPGRLGNRHPNITPYETFPTADGQIAVAVGSERQWLRFCEALGAPDLAADRRFVTNAARVRHREILREDLVARFATRPAAAWLESLAAAEVPCGPVRNLAEVFADPQVLARGMVATVEHPTVGELRLTGIPFKFAATPGSIRRPPPLLGEHTAEVLAELGYSEPGVARLRASGSV